MATTEQTTNLAALIESLGLDYRADFVPFSRSRHAKSNPKLSDLQLNWRISIGRNGRTAIATDYSAGIAHIPGHKFESKPTVHYADCIRKACESGRSFFRYEMVGEVIQAPKLADVLHSLVLDAGAIDSPSFEDWASEFGYDTDSREAERTYKACLDIGLKLRAMIGDEKLDELREAFQDY